MVIKAKEMMNLLGVGRSVLLNLRKTGKLPKHKVLDKGAFGWNKEEVEEWLKTNPKIRTYKRKGEPIKREKADFYRYKVGQKVIDFEGRVSEIEQLTSGVNKSPVYVIKRNGKNYLINETQIWGKK